MALSSFTALRPRLFAAPPDNPPDLPDLSLPHKHRHPGDDGAEYIIILKSLDPPQG